MFSYKEITAMHEDDICDDCDYCCVSDSDKQVLYCGSYFECNPYTLLSTMIPLLIILALFYLCIACCIKRDSPFTVYETAEMPPPLRDPLPDDEGIKPQIDNMPI